MNRVTTVIIGAGQAGLAMSRALGRRGVDHLILEKGAVGHAWRAERWDSLRLLTPNWANIMPGAAEASGDPDGFMSVAAFATSLSTYATAIEAPVREGETVRAVRRLGAAPTAGYAVETDRARYTADAVVLATGACARAHIPACAADAPPAIAQTTPARYKRPSDLPEGGVLVVGASASGVQLAREIHSAARPVTLAVGAHLRLPRRYRGADIERWLHEIGLMDEAAEAIDDLERARRAPSPQLIAGRESLDLNSLQQSGVEIVGRLAAIREGRALFSGGLTALTAAADLKMNRLLDQIDAWIDARGLPFAAPIERPAPTRTPAAPRLSIDLGGGEIRSILWATGYRPDFSYLEPGAFDRRGRLRHRGGVADQPGLYALGLPVLRKRRSHLISGVGEDAESLAEHLIAHLAARRAA